MVVVSCKRCGKKFGVKPSHVAIGYGKYCSRKCAQLAQRTGKEVNCDECGKQAYRTPKMFQRTKSGKFFCTKRCQTLWRNKLYIGEKHTNYKHGRATYRSAIARSGAKKECMLCKTTDFRVLAVHHIDKNRQNNAIENLAYLCHNCHYLVHHYATERERFMVLIA